MTNTFQKELYSDFIRKMRCGSYHGRIILAKPILYSVILCHKYDREQSRV